MEIVEQELMPNLLCDFLYELSDLFTSFYTQCPILAPIEESSSGAAPKVTALREQRLFLTHLSGAVMRQCFALLGLTFVDRMWDRQLYHVKSTNVTQTCYEHAEITKNMFWWPFLIILSKLYCYKFVLLKKKNVQLWKFNLPIIFTSNSDNWMTQIKNAQVVSLTIFINHLK